MGRILLVALAASLLALGLESADEPCLNAKPLLGEDRAVTDLGTFYGLLEDFMKSLEDTRAAMAAETRRREREGQKGALI